MKKTLYFIGIIVVVFLLSACTNDTLTVSESPELEALEVPQFTAFDDLALPSEVTVARSDGESATLRVAWDDARGQYASDQVGTYRLTGDLIMRGDLINREGIQVSIDVVVYAEDVMQTLEGSNNHSILIQAIEAAGLEDTFNSSEALTLFAPTDAAFNDLFERLDFSPSQFYEAEWLAETLEYHVLTRTQTQSALEGFTPMNLDALQGETLRFTMNNNRLTINGSAEATGAEYRTSNGLIQPIDTVLLPASVLSSVGTDLIPDDLADIFFDLIASGDIPLDVLSLLDPSNLEAGVTVFAPNEAALNALADSLDMTVETLLASEQFIDILTYHVVFDSYLASELYEQAPFALESIQGEMIQVTVESDTLKIQNATLLSSESLFGVGFIHTIDQVLIPPSLEETWSQEFEATE